MLVHIFKNIFITFFCVCLIFTLTSVDAHATEDNFLKRWFPILFGESNEPGPEDTLVAPFADNQQQKIQENSLNAPSLGKAQTNLAQSHLSYRELQEWVIEKISIGMNFDDGTFNSNLQSLKPHMAQDAVQGYVNFLGSEGIYDAVINNRKSVSSVISDKPVLTFWDDKCPALISEFIQSGRYHWRFDINVVYTVLDKDAQSYAQVSTNSGRETIIRVLVSRGDPNVYKDGLVILSWDFGKPC